MKRALVVLAGMGWAALLFAVALWVSFPGTAVAERLEFEAQDRSRGAWALDLGDVGPWWFGLSTDGVKVYGSPGRGQPASELMMYATDARAAVSPWSLVRRQPRVTGSVTIGQGGQVDYTLSSALEGERMVLTEARLSSAAFPVDDLLTLVPGEMEASGDLEIDIALDAPDGFSKANGTIRLRGSNITLVQPVIADFPLGRDVVFRDLDLQFEVTEGKARITRGRVASDVANVDLSGEIVLSDDLGRSRADVRADLTLDPSMKMLEGMLSSAARDGRFVYRCAGALNRAATICTPDGTAKAASRRPRSRPSPASINEVKPGMDEKPTIELGTRAGGLSEEDRAQRRKELQERLRQRQQQRADGTGPMRPGEKEAEVEEEPPMPVDEEPLEDELHLDEFEDDGFEE